MSVCQERVYPNGTSYCLAFQDSDVCLHDGLNRKVSYICVMHGFNEGTSAGAWDGVGPKVKLFPCDVSKCIGNTGAITKVTKSGLALVLMLIVSMIM